MASITSYTKAEIDKQLGAKAATADLGAAALLDVGTTTGTVMAGDDSRVTSLSSTYAPTLGAAPVYLDAYTTLFENDALNVFVTGQTAAVSTTLTAPMSVGASMVSLASVDGLLAGSVLVTQPGTASQELHRIASIVGTDANLVAVSTTSAASGATVSPLWANDSHLLSWHTYAYWIAHATDLDGADVFANLGSGKVVMYGDSWFEQGGTAYATAINARFPSATVVNAGVAGRATANLIANFATDVPTDADFVVVNEPGVNDVTLMRSMLTGQLESLIALIRSIGATPVVVGCPPLRAYPGLSAGSAAMSRGALSSRSQFPSVTLSAAIAELQRQPTSGSTRFGLASQAAGITGIDNTAFGVSAQAATTSGNTSCAFGRDAQRAMTTATDSTAMGAHAQKVMTTGSHNTGVGSRTQYSATVAAYVTAVGSQAQYSLTVGSFSTAFGAMAQWALTTGQNNLAIGYAAAYKPLNNANFATTTAQGQTVIGTQSGQGSATQRDYITTIGYKTTADGAGAVAIGTDSGGAGAAATAANEIALGTANHNVKVAGRLNVATRTPTGSADTQGQVGDIATDAEYVYVKTGAGWKRAALTAW